MELQTLLWAWTTCVAFIATIRITVRARGSSKCEARGHNRKKPIFHFRHLGERLGLLVAVVVFFAAQPAWPFDGLQMPIHESVGPTPYSGCPVDPPANFQYSVVWKGAYENAGYGLCEGSGRHPGVDIPMPVGTAIVAVADGVVHHFSATDNSDWGIYIMLRHDTPDGVVYSAYAHLDALYTFAIGQAVTRDDALGKSGNTGSSTGPHLHFQMDRGMSDDHAYPYPYWPCSGDANTPPTDLCLDENTVSPVPFIDRWHYSRYARCSYAGQSPSGVFTVAQHQPAWYLVAFKNEGNTTWYNDFDSHPGDYVELKACDADGIVLHDGSSPLWHRTWKNRESPCTMLEDSVAPGDTAVFLFIGQFSNAGSTVPERAYFRPNHSTGGLMQGWGGMHFQLDVRTGWFATQLPLTNECNGTYDLRAHQWYESDFIRPLLGWVPVTVPNGGWGCDSCDRFFRTWYEYAGTETGQGVTIRFSSDDAIEIWVNGTKLGAWGRGCHGSGCVNGGGGCNPNDSAPDINITSYLHQGPNLIAVHVSEARVSEYFNMTFYSQPLNITDNAICCLGGTECREISASYPSSACITDGGTVFVGDWFDCGTFSSCESPQTKGRSDPTLHLQGPVPVPQGPGSATFQLIDTLPRTAWYDLPEILGGGRIYVSDFTGFVEVTGIASSDPDTLKLVVTDYSFDCPSVALGSIQTGLNYVRLDASAIQDTGFYCIATGMLDVTVQTVLFNDLYSQSNAIRGRNQIRGNLDPETGVLSVGSEGYNALPGPALLPGDVNADGNATAADIIYLVNFIFKSGPSPIPVWQAGDVNCTGTITSSDIVYLVNFVFKSGPAPCDHWS